MKAIILKDYGGVENLQLTELPQPSVREGEVLVSVKAISINPVDAKTRQGGTPLAETLAEDPPVILGWDIAGVVERSLSPVFKKGDAVFGMVNFPGAGRAYADYVAAPANHLALKPANISFGEAAAASLAALTAWQALTGYGHIAKGSRVLIHAGSGGVGHFAIQMARHMGAYILTTTSSPNHEFVKGLGADEAVDYTQTPFEQVAEDIDFVLDTQGGDYIDRSLTVLREGGTLVSLPSNRNGEVMQKAAAKGRNGFRMLVKSDSAGMKALAGLLKAGEILPHLAHAYRFSGLAAAHSQIETGKTQGKLVVLL